METKLCFNCFEKVDKSILQCPKCNTELLDKEPENFKSRNPTNYEKQLENLNDSENFKQNDYDNINLESDLKFIAIFTSFIGLLQIVMTGFLNNMNNVLFVFDTDLSYNSLIFTISGFLYFSSIVLFYVNFKITRLILLGSNFIHIFALYRIGKAIGEIQFFILRRGVENLPQEIINFIDRIKLFQNLMMGFAIIYAFHIVYMFRRELVNIKYKER